MPLEVQLSMCSVYGDKKAAALWVVVKAELRTGLMDWTNYGLKLGLMFSSMFTISFHLKAFDFPKAVPFILYRPCIFPSHLPSLPPFLKTTTTAKHQEQATKKRSEQNLAHVGMEPNQTRWEGHNNTLYHSYMHIKTLTPEPSARKTAHVPG